MNFTWKDYEPETMSFVEVWLDDECKRFTGIDDGFQDFYEYWSFEATQNGKLFCSKVVFENEIPIGIIAIGKDGDRITVMELIVSRKVRNKGKGTKIIEELLLNGDAIIGFEIVEAEAIVFPSNKASQRALEKAGFAYESNDDGDAITYVYNKIKTVAC